MLRTALILTMLLLAPSAAHAETVLRRTTIYDATLRDTCSPWGSDAFGIRIGNRMRVLIYTPFSSIENQGGAVSFNAGADTAKNGGATIFVCDSYGENCKEKPGGISITTIENNIVTGTIQFLPFGWGSGALMMENHTFQAEYDRSNSPPLCQKIIPQPSR